MERLYVEFLFIIYVKEPQGFWIREDVKPIPRGPIDGINLDFWKFDVEFVLLSLKASILNGREFLETSLHVCKVLSVVAYHLEILAAPSRQSDTLPFVDSTRWNRSQRSLHGSDLFVHNHGSGEDFTDAREESSVV
jgi:hypothetical protein